MLMIKVKLFAFTLVLSVLANISIISAKAADTPEQTAKSFYVWYLAELKKDKFPIDRKQTMNKSISKRLSHLVYSPAYEEYGADYFIDAQDYDENWEVATTKAVIKGNKATFKLLLAAPRGKPSKFKQALRIKMVKEGGTWKIDGVNNRELSA